MEIVVVLVIHLGRIRRGREGVRRKGLDEVLNDVSRLGDDEAVVSDYGGLS